MESSEHCAEGCESCSFSNISQLIIMFYSRICKGYPETPKSSITLIQVTFTSSRRFTCQQEDVGAVLSIKVETTSPGSTGANFVLIPPSFGPSVSSNVDFIPGAK